MCRTCKLRSDRLEVGHEAVSLSAGVAGEPDEHLVGGRDHVWRSEGAAVGAELQVGAAQSVVDLNSVVAAVSRFLDIEHPVL